MTSFRERWGIDGFDVALHVAVTLFVMVGVEELTHEDGLMFLAGAVSLVVLGIRRRIALARQGSTGLTTAETAALRVEEVEHRLGELEATQARMAELEERMDFAERLLARTAGERAAVGGRERS